MPRSDSPALRGTWLGRVLRSWNPVMRGWLDSRLHRPLSRWFLLLSWTGARTGRVYTTPASYVRDDTGIFITTGDRWWRYLVGDGSIPIRVRLPGRWVTGRAVPIIDHEESIRAHERLFRKHPWFRRLSGVPATAAGEADSAALARSIAAGRTLLRIEFETGDRREGEADGQSTP